MTLSGNEVPHELHVDAQRAARPGSGSGRGHQLRPQARHGVSSGPSAPGHRRQTRTGIKTTSASSATPTPWPGRGLPPSSTAAPPWAMTSSLPRSAPCALPNASPSSAATRSSSSWSRTSPGSILPPWTPSPRSFGRSSTRRARIWMSREKTPSSPPSPHGSGTFTPWPRRTIRRMISGRTGQRITSRDNDPQTTLHRCNGSSGDFFVF